MSLGLIKPLNYHHVSVAVPDLELAIDWYQRVLGFSVIKRIAIPNFAIGAFVGANGMRIELWCANDAEPVPDERKAPNSDLLVSGTKHVAFSVEGLHDRLPLLKEEDVTIAMEITDPVYAVFINDPFGTLIELIEDPDGNAL